MLNTEELRAAKLSMRLLSEEQRVGLLARMAKELRLSCNEILTANESDLQAGRKQNLSTALLDRLSLSAERIEAMAVAVEEIARQPAVLGEVVDRRANAQGLQISRERIPLGVLLMIFESRPNVVIDAAALGIKSGNVMLLKGGKEALHSNAALANVIGRACAGVLPAASIQVLASDDRQSIAELLQRQDCIDLVIPRGGKGLVEYVYQNAKMPVIAHYEGLCHMYLDASADVAMAIELVINSKTQRPAVCNALETLLIHRSLLTKVAKPLVAALRERATEIRADAEFCAELATSECLEASEEDWRTEYLANILSIKVVSDLQEAVAHIARYGTQHTEAIVSEDLQNVAEFFRQVDASCVVHNASTRFNDGGQLGLGAELGISTSKIHAYGPMGAEQMTSLRYRVEGKGQTRR